MTESSSSPRLYKVPSTGTLVTRVVIEVVSLLLLSYPMLHIYVFLRGNVEPYKRGFFCDDENLKHPQLEEEITVGECVLIWTLIVLVVVPSVELIYFAIYAFDHWNEEMERRRMRWLARVPWVALELYRVLGYFGCGALATLLTTELAKYKVGRLRPYFLTACNPDLSPDLCKDDNGYHVFVTEYVCRGDPGEVREAMKSFLSGHASFSFYCATFLIMYLQARLSRKKTAGCRKRPGRLWTRRVFRFGRILKPVLQLGSFMLAFYIALTRISDYKHHPTDIIAGILVGVTFAVLISSFVLDLFKKPRSFRNEEEDEKVSSDLEMSRPPHPMDDGAAAGSDRSPSASPISHGESKAFVPLKNDVRKKRFLSPIQSCHQ